MKGGIKRKWLKESGVERLGEYQYKEYSSALQSKFVEWDEFNNVKHIWEWRKYIVVDSARVRMKNPESKCFTDAGKVPVQKVDGVWRDLLRAKEGFGKERCIETYRGKERAYVKKIIYIYIYIFIKE